MSDYYFNFTTYLILPLIMCYIFWSLRMINISLKSDQVRKQKEI
jgi:hypothetical protein